MDEQDILKAIEPKSDQLNADDLIGGPITVTIKEVRRGNNEQPIVLVIDGGHRPYKPSKGMARVIVKLFGGNPAKWVGQSLTLFCDPSVKWAGVAVGGIRISHATGINKPIEVMVTVSRGKREAHRIEVLKPPKNDKNERIEKAIAALTNAADAETIEKFWKAVERDLIPVADALQVARLKLAAARDVKMVKPIVVEAIAKGVADDAIDKIGQERFEELKGGE